MLFNVKPRTGFGGDSAGMPEGDLAQRYETLPSYVIHSFNSFSPRENRLQTRDLAAGTVNPIEDPSSNIDRNPVCMVPISSGLEKQSG